MPLNPSNSGPPAPVERRESFRCSVTGLRRHGRLRIGGRTITAHILDESTGGFGVESDEDPGCQIGDTLLVEVGLAWVEVRVMHVARTEHNSEDSPCPDDPTPTRISLLRIRDVDDDEANPVKHLVLAWSRIRSGLTPLVAVGRTCRGTGSMIAAIVASGIALFWVLEHSVPLTKAIQRGAHDAAGQAPVDDPPFVPEPRPYQPRKSAAAPAGPPLEVKTAESPKRDEVKSAQPPRTPKPNVDVPRQATRMAYPKFLLKPDVARLLSLQEEQREQLRKLNQEHLTANAVASRTASSSAQDNDDPLVRLRQKSFEVLTDEQRQLLTKLDGGMDSYGDTNASGEPTTKGGDVATQIEEPAIPTVQ